MGMKLFKMFRKKAEQPSVVPASISERLLRQRVTVLHKLLMRERLKLIKAVDVDFILKHVKSVERSNGIKLTPRQRELIIDAVIEALNEER